jgi:hypothetical protein
MTALYQAPSPRFVSRTLSRFDNFIDSVESMIGHPLTQGQLDDANEAFLEGESAVEFALTITSVLDDRLASLPQEPP